MLLVLCVALLVPHIICSISLLSFILFWLLYMRYGGLGQSQTLLNSVHSVCSLACTSMKRWTNLPLVDKTYNLFSEKTNMASNLKETKTSSMVFIYTTNKISQRWFLSFQCIIVTVMFVKVLFFCDQFSLNQFLV